MDYATLKQSITSYLSEVNLVGQEDLIIELANSRIDTEVAPFAQQETELLTFDGTYTQPYSEEFGGVVRVIDQTNGSRVLQIVSPDEIYRLMANGSTTGIPSKCATDGKNLLINPYPIASETETQTVTDPDTGADVDEEVVTQDNSITIQHTFLKRLMPLTETTPTNWVSENYAGVLLHACLLEALSYLGGDLALVEAKKIDYEAHLASMRASITRRTSVHGAAMARPRRAIGG